MTESEKKELIECSDYFSADSHPYLYYPSDNSQPIFYHFEQSLMQLNEYFIVCRNATEKKVLDIRAEVSNLRNNKIENTRFGGAEDSDLISSYEAANFIEESELVRWEHTQEILVNAMSLILIAAFIEKSLKDFIVFMTNSAVPKLKKKNNESDVDALIRYINNDLNIAFTEPPVSRMARERCRSLRNDFAHGMWDKVEATIRDVSIPSAFLAAKELLKALDLASEIQ